MEHNKRKEGRKGMSKIEAFKKARDAAKRMAAARDCAFGLDSANNDKHQVVVTFTGLASSWSEMKFQMHASYGYYGSSSGYSATSVELGGYLAREISRSARELWDRAVLAAEADAESLRIEAAEEARAVLCDTAADEIGRRG